MEIQPYIRISLFIIFIVAFQVAVARFSLHREAKRRWQHALTGSALVLVSYFLPVHLCTLALLFGAAGIFLIRTFHSDLYDSMFGPLLRPEEKNDINQLPGAFYFLVGALVAAACYPMNTARYSVMCLSLSDPMAAWVGQSIPSPKLHTRASLAGCLACLMTAATLGFVFLYDSTNNHQSLLQISVGAFACTIAEAFPFGNDNLLIPIATATAVQILQ